MDGCDYIGATGINSTTDYIDTQINITSNILNNKIIIVDNKYNNLINTSNTVNYVDGSIYNVDNTYIYNNNQYGEIRFKTHINNNDYYVKIGRDGKLYLWIVYNIVRPEVAEGWYEVSDILADYFFNLAVINFTLVGVGADLVFIQEQVTSINIQIESIIDALYIHTLQINQLIELNEAALVNEYLTSTILDPLTVYQNITARGINTVSRLSTGTASLLTLGGVGFFSWLAVGTYAYFQALREEQIEKNMRLKTIYGELLTNSNASNLDVDDVNNPGYTLRQSLYNNIYSNLSNLNIAEITYERNRINTLGFINSNITTEQIIPNINTSTITINNTGSATYSLINFSNATNNSSGYIGLGGIVSGYHNNNLVYNSSKAHIFNTPGQTSLSIPAFSINASACVGININPSAYPLYRLSVDGDVYIHNAALRTNSIIYNYEELSTTLTNYLLKAGGTMNGRIIFNTGYYQNPSPTGFGDRIVLQSGIGTTGYNYSVGINTDVFWFSSPETSSYKFYSGATNTATLNNAGLLTLPSINATTSITTPSIIYNGTELSTTVGNYLLKSGGTMTGLLTVPTINATTSITTNSIIYNGTELSTTLGNFLLKSGGTMTGQLAITANSASSLISLTNTGTVGQGILQTNNLGGYARLTYYNSGAGGYYTANYVLEASSNSAAIIMNTGGNTSNSIPRFILNSSGNIGIGISNPSAKLEVNGKIGCIGTLNCWSNVGIGATNPYTLLHIRGTNPALTIMGQGGVNSKSQINLSTLDYTTYTPNCSLIVTDIDGDAGATFQITQKLAGNVTNGPFTSFIINKDGNVGIGSTTVTGIKFYVNGKTRFTDAVTFPNSIWHKSVDNIDRFYYDISGSSYFHSGNSGTPFIFRSYAQADIFTISNTGDIGANAGTFGGNIDCGGCLFLTGANSIYNPGGATVDSGNYSNTYLTFKANVAGNDWCHIRQVGSDNFFKLALDFHDDGDDARFCIRNVKSTDTPDTITEVFSVNNGNVACTGNLIVNDITRSRNYFNFGTTLNYQASYNGYNAGGWYFPLNQFWDGYSTASYIHIAITCLGINAVWAGRALVGQGGGLYFLTNEFRTPTGTNQIDVYDIWGGSYNALRITINNVTYAGQFNIKISG